MTEVQDAVWRRVQEHREADLTQNVDGEHELLIPLVLSLARLAAQRDAMALVGLDQSDAG